MAGMGKRESGMGKAGQAPVVILNASCRLRLGRYLPTSGPTIIRALPFLPSRFPIPGPK